MVDSTAIAVIEGFSAERPKSAVLKQPSTERPRCTPTSTLSAPSFIARLTISCPRSPEMPAAESPMLRSPRSVETTRRSALADAADYGWCASHSRFFWGFRLHGLFAPDGTPRAFALASPKRDEREVGIELLGRAERIGGETVIGDKGYAGREFAAAASELGATIVRPARKDEPDSGIHLAPIRQRIESIFWTCKDILTLERHGARTLANLRARIAQRLLALAACVALNHRLGRPSRALVDYVA
jgi:hypothetical protein